MDIGGTIVNQNVVDENGWVKLVVWMGRSCRAIPLSIREPDEGITHVSSLLAAIGDLNCDPRSGGIADVSEMAGYYGVKPQQFKRHILPTLEFVRRLGGIAVSNVSSVHADGLAYQQGIREKRCQMLLQH